VNDDRRRLDDFLAAVDDAGLIVRGGRTVFDADPLVVRTAKNIVTEIGEATKRCRPPRPEPSVGSHGGLSPACETAPSTGYPEVDLDVLWDTMEHDLPDLAGQICLHLDDADL